MLISVAQTIAGMVTLLVGGDLMVRGASSLARSLGISPLAVGLTVVAFGTSAPELAVSVGAALNGSGNLAFGNIYGSNLANIGLIVGLASLIKPLPIDTAVIRRELPMMLLAIAAAIAMAADSLLGEGPAQFSRSDGLVLLLFFFVFIYYTLGDLVAQRSESSRSEEDRIDTANIRTTPGADNNFAPGSEDDHAPSSKRPLYDLVMIVIGIGGLLLGAQWTVDGGITIARAIGIPEVIVGLTVISIGTSLPELVATLTAVRRGELAIAVGGVVGSNIFNTLLVCGVTAAIRPIELPNYGMTDLAFTAVLTLALLLTARTHSRLILRYEGAALLSAYLIYMVWRFQVL